MADCTRLSGIALQARCWHRVQMTTVQRSGSSARTAACTICGSTTRRSTPSSGAPQGCLPPPALLHALSWPLPPSTTPSGRRLLNPASALSSLLPAQSSQGKQMASPSVALPFRPCTWRLHCRGCSAHHQITSVWAHRLIPPDERVLCGAVILLACPLSLSLSAFIVPHMMVRLSRGRESGHHRHFHHMLTRL